MITFKQLFKRSGDEGIKNQIHSSSEERWGQGDSKVTHSNPVSGVVTLKINGLDSG